MTWRFLRVEDVVALHEALINDTGGSHGLRDAGLLESAIARAENKVSYDPDATVPTVAASLAWGLIKNHAFIDGNKRIGLATLVVFLDANGFVLKASVVEETAMVLPRRRQRDHRRGVGRLGRSRRGTEVVQSAYSITASAGWLSARTQTPASAWRCHC